MKTTTSKEVAPTVRMTALGYFVGIYPWQYVWHVVAFDRRGNWKFASPYPSEPEAKAERSAIFRHHNDLAKQRAARSAKQKSHTNRCTARVDGQVCGTIMHSDGSLWRCRVCNATRRISPQLRPRARNEEGR